MAFRGQSSLIAIAAVAGVALATTGVSAADLGGNCCADLEERVAELEATAARKGNRKVSLQIYGQVSEAIVWWNDGAEKNAYVVENDDLKNRVGFRGDAKINSDWSAGFLMELQIRAYRSSSANQLSLGASNNVQIPTYNTQSVALRQANWYIESKTWGRITVGRSNDATNGLTDINLANPDGFTGLGVGYALQGYFLRRSGTTGNTGLSAFTWRDAPLMRNGSGPASFGFSETGAGIKYTSPFFLGQTKSSGFRFDSLWAMDDYWSVALRYAESFGAFRIAAGAGYAKNGTADRGQCSLGAVGNATNAASGGSNPTLASTIPQSAAGSNVDCTMVTASASVMHTPTGLYVSAGGGYLDDKGTKAAAAQASGLAFGARRPGIDDTNGVWYVQGGWEAKLNTLGATTFWAQTVQYETGFGLANSLAQNLAASDVLNSLGSTALIGGAKTRIWGLGVSQEISAAAMTLYAGFHNISTDITLINQSPTATVQRARSNSVDDMQIFYSGATLRF